ncbi:hypothetical protein [Nocardia paucivorans]|uniref:hypothetical protein n=1 Tax=Nocardia paucivorans TaxID=114259 RepID=UPI0002EAFD28|nr:hypothetical protein [Nocardia paucivorans]
MKSDELEYLGDADEQKCISAILSHYEWEAYNYKSVAWVRKPRRWRSWRTGENYKWVRSVDTPIQLISRTTGEPVSEVVRYRPASRFGVTLFAGDPTVVGVFRDMRSSAGRRQIWFTHSTSIDRDTAIAIGLSITRYIPMPRNVPPPRFSDLIWVADELEEYSNNIALVTGKRHLRKILG